MGDSSAIRPVVEDGLRPRRARLRRASRDRVRRSHVPGQGLCAGIGRPVHGEGKPAGVGSHGDLHGSGCELKIGDTCAPVKRASRSVIFLSIPEGRVVHWVDGDGTVIAPAVARTGLAARAGNYRGFTL